MHVTKQADRLGTIVMLELRDKIAIPHGVFKQHWEALGLPDGDLPKPRNPKDAFRKATPGNRAVNGLQLEPYLNARALAKAGLQLAVVMTRVGDAKTRVSKLHRNRLVLGLNQADEFVYQGEPVDDDEVRYLAQVQREYQALTEGQILDGKSVRRAMQNAALHANAFLIKGGVYMFPEVSVPTGEALVALAGILDGFVPVGSSPNETMVIDYFDTPEQRDQLKTKLDLYVREAIERRIRAFHEGTDAGKRAQKNVFTDLAELAQMIEQYERLLQESLVDLHAYERVQRAMLKEEIAKL